MKSSGTRSSNELKLFDIFSINLDTVDFYPTNVNNIYDRSK